MARTSVIRRRHESDGVLVRVCGSNFSTQNKPAPPRPSYLNVFDRQAKLLQRRRAANLNKMQSVETSGVYDYIKDEVLK